MRILIVHNRYVIRGGEDAVVDADVALLRARGHDVTLHEVANTDPSSGSAAHRASVAARAVWSPAQAARARYAAQIARADVVHVHNHAYALSAAIYPALAAVAPVVATLHNYRMTCSNAYLLREDRECMDCVGSRAAWRGVKHSCFRGSRVGSMMLAGMQLAWRRAALASVSRWLVPSESAREVWIRAGLVADRVSIHPNVVPDRHRGSTLYAGSRRGALIVGRLSPEKGVRQIVDAWLAAPRIDGHDLRVVGDGPDRLALEHRIAQANRRDVQLLGALSAEQVAREQRQAAVVLVPSCWRETFGLVAVEAFAAATPVVASDIGALTTIVTDDVGWRLAPPRSSHLAAHWVSHIHELLATPSRLVDVGHRARHVYDMQWGEQPYVDRLERLLTRTATQAASGHDTDT